jgi:hypothetical protein
MINCVFKHPTYLDFHRFCAKIRADRPDGKLTANPFRDFKEEYKLKRLCEFQSKLRSYMIIPMLGVNYRFDESMRCKSPDAVRWRCGSYKTRAQCPKCLKIFNRAHITRCDLLSDCGTACLTKQLPAFNASKDALTRAFVSSGGTATEYHFTVIDFLLNASEYDAADAIFDYLRDEFASASTARPKPDQVDGPKPTHAGPKFSTRP